MHIHKINLAISAVIIQERNDPSSAISRVCDSWRTEPRLVTEWLDVFAVGIRGLFGPDTGLAAVETLV
jgi:hypothetical protein